MVCKILQWGMRLCVLLTLVILANSSFGAERCPKTGVKLGYWSRLAAVVCEDAVTDQMRLEAPSPDGRKMLFVRGRDLDGRFFLKSNHGGVPKEVFAAWDGSEALWSVDSKAIAVTTCFGGSGPCVVETTLADERDTPNEIVRKAFSAGHENDPCYADVNVGAVTWEHDSERIVVVAEVPPSPQCEGHNAGYFEAFVVSLPERKVISRFNMEETIRRWRSILGTGLRNDIGLVRDNSKDVRK